MGLRQGMYLRWLEARCHVEDLSRSGDLRLRRSRWL